MTDSNLEENILLPVPKMFLIISPPANSLFQTAGFESSPIIETFQTFPSGVERYGTIAAFIVTTFTHPGEAKCIFKVSSASLNAETIFSTTTGLIHSWYASAQYEYKVPIATTQLDSNVDYYIFCAQSNISQIAILKVNSLQARFRLNEHWDDGKIYRDINVGATRASVATKFAKTGIARCVLGTPNNATELWKLEVNNSTAPSSSTNKGGSDFVVEFNHLVSDTDYSVTCAQETSSSFSSRYYHTFMLSTKPQYQILDDLVVIALNTTAVTLGIRFSSAGNVRCLLFAEDELISTSDMVLNPEAYALSPSSSSETSMAFSGIMFTSSFGGLQNNTKRYAYCAQDYEKTTDKLLSRQVVFTTPSPDIVSNFMTNTVTGQSVTLNVTFSSTNDAKCLVLPAGNSIDNPSDVMLHNNASATIHAIGGEEAIFVINGLRIGTNTLQNARKVVYCLHK